MLGGVLPDSDPRPRESATTLPVYGQLPFVPERAAGCDIITADGRHILDLYGGHAVAALGYGHPALINAISEQSSRLLFQSNAVALEVRVENLTDEFTYDGLNNNGGILPSHFFGHKRPRTAGVRFRYSWE